MLCLCRLRLTYSLLFTSVSRYVFGGVYLTLTNKYCDSNAVVTEDSPGCWGPTEPVNSTMWMLNTVPYAKAPPWKWQKKVCRPDLNQTCPPALSEHTMVQHNGNCDHSSYLLLQATSAAPTTTDAVCKCCPSTGTHLCFTHVTRNIAALYGSNYLPSKPLTTTYFNFTSYAHNRCLVRLWRQVLVPNIRSWNNRHCRLLLDDFTVHLALRLEVGHVV